jgi:hypothetical protein
MRNNLMCRIPGLQFDLTLRITNHVDFDLWLFSVYPKTHSDLSLRGTFLVTKQSQPFY